jgi:oligoribonuclease (3'-5' exoribonuclease)
VHFDVDVMRRHLPLSAGRLHYRHLDLTTLDLASPLGKAPRPPSTHRALHDAMAELLELKNRGIA